MRLSQLRVAILPMLLVAGISGCASSLNSEDTVFAIRSGYNATFLAPAAHYATLPRCTPDTPATITAPCSEQSVVTALQKADASALAALDAAENVVRNNPKLDSATFIRAAQSAVTAAMTIITTYGVK